MVVGCSDLGESYELGDILRIIVPVKYAVRAPEGEVGPAHVAVIIFRGIAFVFLLAVSLLEDLLEGCKAVLQAGLGPLWR